MQVLFSSLILFGDFGAFIAGSTVNSLNSHEEMDVSIQQ